MGKIDTVAKEYMSNPIHFADAFNYLFDGTQVISSEYLQEKDTTELGIFYDNGQEETTQKIRDVLRQCIIMEDETSTYLILGVENQSFVHYAMPAKNMIYDALNYQRQIAETTKRHRQRKDLKGDGPRRLTDMFERRNEKTLPYVNDYKLNIIIPKEIEDFSKFQSDFGKAMKYLSVSDDKEKYYEVANEEEYKIINTDTAKLLNACTGIKLLIEEGVEQMEVCKAIRDIEEDAKMEGRREAIEVLVEALQKLGQTSEFILQTLMEGFSISEGEAKKYMK